MKHSIYFIFVFIYPFVPVDARFIFSMMSAKESEWSDRNVIQVTGFGPFRDFIDVNPSWEAVSRLPDHIEHNGKKLIVEKHKIAVTYEAVDEIVPKLWQEKPLVSST